MIEISVYRGEVKPITLTITNEYKQAVDLSGATLFLAIKRHKNDDVPVISKYHADFDTGSACLGIVSFTTSRADTEQVSGRLVGQIRAIIAGTTIYSDEFYLNVEDSVIPGPFVADGAGTIPAATGEGA